MGTPRTDEQTLREQWAARMAEARRAAASAGGQVDDETMKALDRLHRLAHWEAPAPPRQRAPLLLLALALAVAASVLLFARVSSTDIDVQADTGALRLQLQATQPFSASWHLAQVALAGAERIDGLPGTAGNGAARAGTPATTAVGALRLQALEPDRAGHGNRLGGAADMQADTQAGSLVLQPIVLPAGAQVALQVVEEGRALRLQISAPKLVLRISVQGPVQWVAAGSAAERWNATVPQALDVYAGADAVDLVLVPRAGTAPGSPLLQWEAPLAVAALSFAVVDPQSLAAVPLAPAGPTLAPPAMQPRQVSTLQSGTLSFDSLQGRTRTLRSGETLHWRAATGTVQSLRWRGAGIEWHYAATVVDLSTGLGPNAHSLMPSWLDWLQARHGLWLLWGALLSGFGLLVAVLRWWGLRL